MIDKTNNLIYNLDYIVCLPTYDIHLLEAFNFTFGNVIVVDHNKKDVEDTISFLKKNNVNKVIFVDYYDEYQTILNEIDQSDINFIFTKTVASFSDPMIYKIFNGILDLYQKGIVHRIGLLEEGLYEVLKCQKYPAFHLMLDVEAQNNCREVKDQIGLLSDQSDPKHSFYNGLSAICLIDNYKVNIYKPNQQTKRFIKQFAIDTNYSSNLNELFYTNQVNLYVNFTNNDISLFLKSMDSGIPCIIGNNEILKTSNTLYNQLMVESDDDVTEISQKIKFCIKHKHEIMNEYHLFRSDYKKKVIKKAEEFLRCPLNKKSEQKDYECLLTVVVPVYNVESYIASCLDSIIKAKIPNMEVLVINDGSTDQSEKVILPYVERYPDLIKYIKQENHGLGNVRNVGLKYAKGKYIASIDSDDTIHSNFFREALPYLEKDVDIIFCDWKSIPEKSSAFDTNAIDGMYQNFGFNQYKAFMYTTIMPSTCNKIFKRSLYDNINLKFIENLKFEDLGTNPVILLLAHSFKYINAPYYEYKIRGDSIMRTSVGYHMIDIIKIINDRIHEFVPNPTIDMNEFMYYTFYWRIEESIINQLYELKGKKIDTFIEYMNNELESVLQELFKNPFVIEFINQLPKEEQTFYKARNKALLNHKLSSFIKKAQKEKKIYKLTAAKIIYTKLERNSI